jgi:hypothetical protein
MIALLDELEASLCRSLMDWDRFAAADGDILYFFHSDNELGDLLSEIHGRFQHLRSLQKDLHSQSRAIRTLRRSAESSLLLYAKKLATSTSSEMRITVLVSFDSVLVD